MRHAQRVAVVLVVGAVDAEIDVAGAAIERDRGGVVRVDLEAHDRGAAIQRRRLGRLQQRPAEAAAALLGRHRHRVQPGERGPAVEQDQRIADQPTVLLGDQAFGGVAGEKVAEAASRQAVVLEGLLLQLEQPVKVLGHGWANQQSRPGHGAPPRALKLGQGGHRRGASEAEGARAVIAPRYKHRDGPREDGTVGS